MSLSEIYNSYFDIHYKSNIISSNWLMANHSRKRLVYHVIVFDSLKKILGDAKFSRFN